ncbi:hypothetical protein F7R02_14425 [Xanthomonas cissicola]|nr:hypothetical protein F7R02_14425 [Xanthomonas cissicola]
MAPDWISAGRCQPGGSLAGSLAGSLPVRRSARLPATDIARALRIAPCTCIAVPGPSPGHCCVIVLLPWHDAFAMSSCSCCRVQIRFIRGARSCITHARTPIHEPGNVAIAWHTKPHA